MSNSKPSEDAELFLKRSGSGFPTPFLMRFHGQMIAEQEAASPGFAGRLRLAALGAIESGDSVWIGKGLAALAHVGTSEDLPRIQALAEHLNPAVAADARTCRFEIEHRSG